MRYWLLTWNPKTFDLAAARRDGQPIGDWRVGRFRDELQVGDRFLFWRSGGGGIAALGRIGGAPVFKPVPSPDYWTEVPVQAFRAMATRAWRNASVEMQNAWRRTCTWPCAAPCPARTSALPRRPPITVPNRQPRPRSTPISA
ncbi:EVE domain-containing protein [Herbidospora galbida]|uniref:EVE domain-containing protein n=1 Tax=Herbidospora galbida TaxID=2575442 RepID=A0A4U3MIJ1_9ACTN|nr:EVE domain-containing protein [Herbidospora galbida]